MKTNALVLLVFLAGLEAFASAQAPIPAQSQSQFHVTNVHDWTINDPSPVSRAFKTVMVIGVVGSRKYTTEQLFSWGSQRFDVGTDYVVAKQDDKSLTVIMHDKKGHELKERLDVVGVDEVTK